MKRLCLIFLLLIHSSCIPAYLPEYNKIKSDSSLLGENLQRLIKKQTVVIVQNPEQEEEKSLGHQYLFGIIPFTSIYLKESADILVTKVLEDLLTSFGYNTIISNSSDLETVIKNQEVKFFIQGKIKNLSVSGFDVLFFRYLSVAGNVDFKAFKNIKSYQDNQPSYQQQYPLNKSIYKLTAHLSELNLLLEKSLRDKTIKFVTDL